MAGTHLWVFEDRLGAAPMGRSDQNGAPWAIPTVCVTPDEFNRMSPLPVEQTSEGAFENMASRRQIGFRECLALPLTRPALLPGTHGMAMTIWNDVRPYPFAPCFQNRCCCAAASWRAMMASRRAA